MEIIATSLKSRTVGHKSAGDTLALTSKSYYYFVNNMLEVDILLCKFVVFIHILLQSMIVQLTYFHDNFI